MLVEVIKIVIAGLIVLAVGYPFVVTIDKWKKEMDKKETEDKDDVH